MNGLWTPNSEADADRNAPILAQVSAAAGIYVYIHSRVFASKNNVRLSVTQLAETLGIDRRTAQRAIKELEKAGVLKQEKKPGNGGGSIFQLVGISDAAYPPGLEDDECGENAASNAATSPRSTHANAAHLPHLTRRTCRTTKIREILKEEDHESGCIYDK